MQECCCPLAINMIPEKLCQQTTGCRVYILGPIHNPLIYINNEVSVSTVPLARELLPKRNNDAGYAEETTER
jgi:hypothetical protein